jgi:hypothetical protein
MKFPLNFPYIKTEKYNSNSIGVVKVFRAAEYKIYVDFNYGMYYIKNTNGKLLVTKRTKAAAIDLAIDYLLGVRYNQGHFYIYK